MITKIEKITPQSLAEAKKIIAAGGVVAIPTETVYGLGGNAFDDGAVKRIFESRAGRTTTRSSRTCIKITTFRRLSTEIPRMRQSCATPSFPGL